MSIETILGQLKAETLLSGSWILSETKRFSQDLMYQDGEELVSYKTFFDLLLKEVEQIPSIQLLPVVASGTSRAYLIDLTSGLERVMDRIEVTLNRVLFFQSKAKSASTAIKNLRDTFKAWYLIGLQQELKRFEIKLSNKALEALSDSEFTRLLGDTGSDLEALDMALALLADRLKSRKKLAMEKYTLGKDQANASLIPMLGSQAGIMEGRTGMDLLKDKYGLGERGSLVMDDPPENLMIRKPVPIERLGTADAIEATHDFSPALEGRVATASDMHKGVESEIPVDLGVFNFDEMEDDLPEPVLMGDNLEDEVVKVESLRGPTHPIFVMDEFRYITPDPEEEKITQLLVGEEHRVTLGVPTTELRPDALGVFSDEPVAVDEVVDFLPTSKTKKRKMLFEDPEETNVQTPISQPKVEPAVTSTELNARTEPLKKRRILFDD